MLGMAISSWPSRKPLGRERAIALDAINPDAAWVGVVGPSIAPKKIADRRSRSSMVS
jgi:hypothetical protein